MVGHEEKRKILNVKFNPSLGKLWEIESDLFETTS